MNTRRRPERKHHLELPRNGGPHLTVQLFAKLCQGHGLGRFLRGSDQSAQILAGKSAVEQMRANVPREVLRAKIAPLDRCCPSSEVVPRDPFRKFSDRIMRNPIGTRHLLHLFAQEGFFFPGECGVPTNSSL